MGVVKNILAVIGLLALIAVLAAYLMFTDIMGDFDPGARELYGEFISKMIETQDLARTMVWAVPVEEGVSAADVEDSLKSLAVANNFLFVGESPFYKQAQAVTGKPFRHIAFLTFCDVRVGIAMADYNDAYTAFMPCTISVVEDKEGKLWLYALNMDFLIRGARELPPDIKEQALKVRQIIRDMMEGAAKGEF
jgi:uncharacterized protein (DUF302 family)